MSPAQPISPNSLRRLSHLTLAALLACAMGAANAADFYRWTDDQGLPHYSDKPPKGVKAEKVKNKTRKPTAEEEELTAAENQTSNPDAERCKAEQERLRLLKANSRIQMEDKDGKLRELTAKEIEEEIAFSQRAVQRFCNPSGP
jgi:hypothetical protein